MNQELLDEWEEISKRYGFDKQQVYIEDLYKRKSLTDMLGELIDNIESINPYYGEFVDSADNQLTNCTIQEYALDLGRKYLKAYQIDGVSERYLKTQCTSSSHYPRKNYKFNFGFDSNDYEEDMLLLKGLRPAKTVAHLDRDEDHGYITDISELKNMLKDQVDS